MQVAVRAAAGPAARARVELGDLIMLRRRRRLLRGGGELSWPQLLRQGRESVCRLLKGKQELD